ncbi:MAG: type II toxin-antitoxin system VapC family toxin [Acidobacteriia bacterium]|nr:type II toxin-antitoxin system VapC family toxin [Terriglobia bacterium]
MSRYLLDTNTASYIIKGTFPQIRPHLTRVPMERICVSAVTEGELRYGVARNPDAKRLRNVVDEFLLRVWSVPWDSEAARAYGQLRADLEKGGKPIGNLDLMIAAHALSMGAILVSHDHVFERIGKLKVVDRAR